MDKQQILDVMDLNTTVSSYFKYPIAQKIPAITIDWFTNVTDLVMTHYDLIKDCFILIKNNYSSFVLGRAAPLWNSCNFVALQYHLYLGHRRPFLSTSIMLYNNPITHWRRCFILLKAIFTNRYASVFFIGSKQIGNLSEILNKINIRNIDNFFHAIDYWYGGFLNNIRNIYSMPHGVIQVRNYSKLKNKALFGFYTKLYRRPSCIIALRYGEGAYHADLECFKYRIPMLALSDTDSKPSGFSKAMYIIPTTNFNQNMISWYLLVFMYILRHVRYLRLCRELDYLNSHMTNTCIDRSIADEDNKSALHTLTIAFKSYHKRTELVNIEKMSIKLKKYKKEIKIQNRNFYDIIRLFLEVITIIVMALSIKKQGLINYYYKTIFLFTKKKFTKILVILSYLFERFSKNKNYMTKYSRLVSEKNIAFLDTSKSIAEMTSRKSWLKSYLSEFPGSKAVLLGKRVILKNKMYTKKLIIKKNKNLDLPEKKAKNFDVKFFKYYRDFKKEFYKKSNKIKSILRKKYFRFQFRKKLKIIQIKQYKTLSGFVAPRQFINTAVWKRLTIDELMAKRSAALFFRKPKPKTKKYSFKKKMKSFPVFSKKRKDVLSHVKFKLPKKNIKNMNKQLQKPKKQVASFFKLKKSPPKKFYEKKNKKL